jgi:hypothetical protein
MDGTQEDEGLLKAAPRPDQQPDQEEEEAEDEAEEEEEEEEEEAAEGLKLLKEAAARLYRLQVAPGVWHARPLKGVPFAFLLSSDPTLATPSGAGPPPRTVVAARSASGMLAGPALPAELPQRDVLHPSEITSPLRGDGPSPKHAKRLAASPHDQHNSDEGQ